jgi:uncharacterized membrane protein
MHAIDGFLRKLPLLRFVYPLLKKTVELIFSKDHVAFKKALLVEYPCKGVWSIGFLMNKSCQELCNKTQQMQLLNILIPLAPNPTSGYIVFVPESDVIYLDMSIKDAMQLVITGGVINPSQKLA